MRKTRLVALALALCILVGSVPVMHAAEDEPINVMKGATCIRTVNVNTDKYSASSYGGVSDPSKMTDGRYGMGPSHKDESFNTRPIDKWRFYDADGNEDTYADYLWTVTFALDGEYTIDSLTLITDDLTTCGIGNTSAVQWLQRGFDILVSDTGLPGSWVLAHRAEDLHTDTNSGEYTYVAPTDDFPLGYYQYTAFFNPVKAKYIQYGCTDYTSYTMDSNHWINISELEIYTVGKSTPDPSEPPVEAGNVMRNATFIKGINMREDLYKPSQYGGVSGPDKVKDGRYGMGPTQMDDSLNTKVEENYRVYSINGDITSTASSYLWYIVFRLDDEYTIDRFSLMIDDLTTCGIGDTNAVQWLQKNFDILVSDTGEAESWRTVYAGRDLHTDSNKGKYQYIAPTEERPLGYYQLDGRFAPVKARYVCLASTGRTSITMDHGDWVNIAELQVFETDKVPANPTQTTLPLGENVMRNAYFEGSVNLGSTNYDAPKKLFDGKWADSFDYTEEGMNLRVQDAWTYYSADGYEDGVGEYVWMTTFELDQRYKLNGFRLITDDLTSYVGSTDPIQWLQKNFDILISDTGTVGSWYVLYSGRNLHTEDGLGSYVYHPVSVDKTGYYELTANFSVPESARYVRLAARTYTSDVLSSPFWVNITELEIYGEAEGTTDLDSGRCGDNLTWELNKYGTLTISGTGDMRSFLEYGSPWYSHRETITHVVVGEGVTSVGNYAFSGLSKVESVSLPSTMTQIGDYAFDGCRALASVNIPNGVTAIGDYAFRYCRNIISIPVPDAVSTLGDGVFYGCAGLQSATLPKGITKIPKEMFWGCDNLMAFVIPEGVTEIGEYAFTNSYLFGNVTFPDSVKTIGQWAFFGCRGMDAITLGEGVTSVGDKAFGNCIFVKTVYIPASATTIAENAFYDCSRIEKFVVDSANPAYMADINGILFTKDRTTLLLYPAGRTAAEYTVPYGVVNIGQSAFSGSSLTRLVLPRSVKKVNFYVFNNCSRLTDLVVLSRDVDWMNGPPSATTLHGYAGSTTETYANTYNRPFQVIREGGVFGRVTTQNPAVKTTVRLVFGGIVYCTYVLEAEDGVGSVTQYFHLYDGLTLPDVLYDVVIEKEGHLSYTITGISLVNGEIDLTAQMDESLSNITVPAGDVNGDGCIDLRDLVTLTSDLNFGLSYEEAADKSADVNGDRSFDLRDLVIITSDAGYGRAPICVQFGK